VSGDGTDRVDELLPRVLSKYEQYLRECVTSLLQTGQACVDLPPGYIRAELVRTGPFRRRTLRTFAYRGTEEVMRGEVGLTAADVAEERSALLRYLAVAAVNALFEVRW
jgi:hypothetical protein